MANKREETASFMIRFTQKIFHTEKGEPQVQWRGNIRHVQGGDEKRFSEFDDVVAFIQQKLTDLTIVAMEDKSPEEQKGILAKSFDLWKKVAIEAPKLVAETIKDPKKKVADIQDQIQDQIFHVKDEINQKLEIGSWLAATKNDNNLVMKRLEEISASIHSLSKKVDELSK